MSVFGVVAFYKFVKISALEGIGLEDKILIRPEVINPELLCPWWLT